MKNQCRTGNAKWIWRSCALLLLLSLLLASCGRKDRVITYDIDAAPQNLDPQSAQDSASRLVIANLFEGLVRLDETGGIQPAAAERYTVSADGLTYRFVLREDGKWSDGTAVTAEDFVYAFRRLFAPETGAPDVEQFLCIAGSSEALAGHAPVESIGVSAQGNVLTINLETPNSRFLQLLTLAAAMPCKQEFFLETKGKYGLESSYVMGNGPFMLRSWLDTLLRMKPNSAYRETVQLDQVTLPFLSEQEQDREERFLAGNTSAAVFLSDITGKFDNTYQIAEHANTVWGLLFQEQESAFANEALRRAFCQAADFDRIADRLSGQFRLTDQLIPSSVLLGEERYRLLAGEARTLSYDPATAAMESVSALQELQLETLSGFRVILPEGYGHEEYFAALSQGWQRDLKAYFTVEVLPAAEYAARLSAGSYDCALAAVTGNSPAAALERFAGDSDDALRLLLNRAETTEPLEEAAAIYREAEKRILQSGTFLPFYEQNSYFVQQKGVQGIQYHFDSGLAEFYKATVN